MVKNKLTLNKSELVEIIASTVTTIEEQTAGDLGKSMGDFGGFYNWKWADQVNAYTNITDTHSESTSNLIFETIELSAWDTGEDLYKVHLKLDPSEYAETLIKMGGDFLKDEKIVMTIKSYPPDRSTGTNWIRWQVNEVGTRYMWGEHVTTQEIANPQTDTIDITWEINVDPTHWYKQNIEEKKETYNWAIGATARGDEVRPEDITDEKMDHLSKDNYAGEVKYYWTTWVEFLYGGVVQGKAKVVLDIDLRMGIMGFIVQKEFIKQTPFMADGGINLKNTTMGRMMDYKNWSFNTKLDALAFVFFMIAGFFSEGVGWLAAARYVSWGAYVTVVGINAYDYIKKGDFKMAGIHILFEFLMFTKPLKWFKGGVEFLKTTKGVTWMTTKISTGLKYISKGAGKTTIKAAGPTLNLLKNNPGARRMIRMLASGGEETLKAVKGNLKRAGTYKDVTKEMAEEFIALVVKSNPKFAGKITIIQARKIITQGAKRESRKLLQALVAIPEMVVSAVLLISLYDINMIMFPFKVYVQGLDPKKYKPIDFKPLSNLQDYLYEKMGKSDIDFKVPMYDVEGKEIVLQDLFGWWRVKDLISKTPMPDSAFNYNWEFVRASYVASISSPHVKAGLCPTIPRERHNLFENNEYTPESDEERMNYKAKQIAKTAGEYQGVKIEASKLIGRGDVNTSLKEDWINGWRPEQNCNAANVEAIIILTREEIDEVILELPPPEGEIDAYGNTEWKTYIAAGAKKYYDINGKNCLEIEVGDKSYFLCQYPTKETLKWFNTLPKDIKNCLKSLMTSLAKFDSLQESNETFIDWPPPPTCTKLGIDWTEWLGESNVQPTG